MKRILLLSLVFLAAVLILPSCTESPVATPTPTIDHGKYTPAEAAGIVREYLYSRAKCSNAVGYVSRLSLGAYYNGLGKWTVGDFWLYENSATVVPASSKGTYALSYIESLNKLSNKP